MTTNKDFYNFLKFLEEKRKIETEDGASVADKLNPFLAPGSRDTKTGEYKPKDPDVEYGKKDLAADLASVGPPVTSIPGAAYGTYRSLQRGEYGQAALNALGVIPGVGLLTKGTKLASTGQKISKFAGHADVGGSLGSVAKDVYDATKDDEPKPIQPTTPSEPKKVKPINIPNEPSQTSKIEPVKVKPIKIQPESGGKSKMTDKKKSISEALAEVQRNAEIKKIEEAKKVWGDALDENILMERGGTSRSEKFFRPMKDWLKGKNADVNPPSSRAGDNAKDITGKATEIKPDTSKGRTKIEPVETPAPKTGSGLAGKVSTGLSGLALGGIAAAGLLGAGKKADEPAKPTELPKIDVPGEKKSSDDMTFGQAFAAARKAATEKGAKSTGQFEYKGKQYQTNIQGKGAPKAPEEKYVAPTKQTKVDIGTTKASAPTSTETPAPAPSKPSQGFSGSSKDSTLIGPDPTKFTKPETESGGKKKKMSEETNPMIAAFLKLQSENTNNMFEAAKKAKKDYDKDGKVESPKDEVWGSRFAAAKRAGKMEEGNIDPVITGSSSVTKSKTGYVDPSTPKVPYSELPKPGNAAGDVLSKAKNALDKTGVKEESEVTFSQEEIDHINSFFLEASVAPTRPEVAIGADSTSDKMSQNDVTGTAESGGKKKIKEESDAADETNMAKTQLKAMSSKAMNLHSKLKTSKKLPAWVQSKLAVAKDGVTAVDDYMTHSDKIKEEAEHIEELSGATIGSYVVGSKRDEKARREKGIEVRDQLSKQTGMHFGTPIDRKLHSPTASRGAMQKLAIKKLTGTAKISANEETLDEGGMPSSVIAHKQKLANMSDKEFAEKHGHKSEKELRDMAARHGYGWDKATKTGSDHYVKRVASINMKEETLEEGRPKKNPTPETTERDPRKHIQVEAGRAAAGNVVDFHHNDGTKSKITPAMGRRITSHLNSLKPADRQSAVNKMHDSAEGLKV
jgi:hypothetical protein